MSSTISANGLAHRCFWLNWKFKLIEGSIADNRRELIDAGTSGVSTVSSAIDQYKWPSSTLDTGELGGNMDVCTMALSCFDRPNDIHEQSTITTGV